MVSITLKINRFETKFDFLSDILKFDNSTLISCIYQVLVLSEILIT